MNIKEAKDFDWFFDKIDEKDLLTLSYSELLLLIKDLNEQMIGSVDCWEGG